MEQLVSEPCTNFMCSAAVLCCHAALLLLLLLLQDLDSTIHDI
jgi:hypothetical protein